MDDHRISATEMGAKLLTYDLHITIGICKEQILWNKNYFQN